MTEPQQCKQPIGLTATALRALVHRINEIADTMYSGNELRETDLLNVAQALATDKDAEILFRCLVEQLRAQAVLVDWAKVKGW